MTRTCALCGCKDNKSRPPGVSFYSLPQRNPQLCTQWLTAINLPLDTPPTSYSKIRICSQHFCPEDFDYCFSAKFLGNAVSHAKKLNPGALPRNTTVSSSTLTESPSFDTDVESLRDEPTTSTPQKVPRTQQRNTGLSRNPAVLLSEEMNISFSSIETLEATQTTYKPDTDCTSSASSVTDVGTAQLSWQEKKVVVSESKVLELFRFCQTCATIIEKREVSYLGSQMRVKWECAEGHSGTWTSCPSERGMPQSNLLLAAAILFTGSTFTKLEEWAKLINLQIFSSSTFYDIQNSYLHPVIQAEFELQKSIVLAKLFMEQQDGKMTHLSSDGRSDSPGFNAKYTTYTFMADPGREIVHSELVQVTETTSSGAMETVALRRGLDHLLDNGLHVEVLATDRSTSVKKIMREEYEEIDHQFDIWHTAKNIQSKLIAKSKKRGCAALKPWIRSVRNHLWYSTAKAGGNVKTLKSTWNSILHHIIDEHTWTEGGTEHSCHHPPLTDEDREKKMWLCKDSEAYQELSRIVLNTTLQKDLENMVRFKHTGALEVFHSSLLKYAPKRQCFSYQSMKQRTNLAIMHHNENLTQKPKLDSEGKPVIIQEWSKRSKEWFTRKRYQQTTVNFRTRLMQLVLERRNDPTVIFRDTSSTLLTPDLPANIGTVPKPSKDDAGRKHKSRFAK